MCSHVVILPALPNAGRHLCFLSLSLLKLMATDTNLMLTNRFKLSPGATAAQELDGLRPGWHRQTTQASCLVLDPTC